MRKDLQPGNSVACKQLPVAYSEASHRHLRLESNSFPGVQTLIPASLLNKTACNLGINSWSDLSKAHKAGTLTFIAGDLGASRVPNIFLSWVCVQGYTPWVTRCGGSLLNVTSADSFCFVFMEDGDKNKGTFMPWGLQSDLRLRTYNSKNGACTSAKSLV